MDKGGEGQIGLSRSGEEVENPCRVVVREKKKKSFEFNSEVKVHLACSFMRNITPALRWYIAALLI